MSTCPHCGGSMTGDGFTTPRICENFDPNYDIGLLEPDSGPWYCSHNPACDGCGTPTAYSNLRQVIHTEPDETTDSYFFCHTCMGIDPRSNQ